MIHADFYFSRGGGSILKEDPVEPIHDVLHRIADLLLIDRKAGIQHSLNGVRRVSKVITDAVEMVLCQDRLPFFGKDEVGSSNLPSSSTKNLETTMVSRFFLFLR